MAVITSPDAGAGGNPAAPLRQGERPRSGSGYFPAVAYFPWPVTDDELILNGALAAVMGSYDARGDNEENYVKEVAANLIIEAYNQGIRDADLLARCALKALRENGVR